MINAVVVAVASGITNPSSRMMTAAPPSGGFRLHLSWQCCCCCCCCGMRDGMLVPAHGRRRRLIMTTFIDVVLVGLVLPSAGHTNDRCAVIAQGCMWTDETRIRCAVCRWCRDLSLYLNLIAALRNNVRLFLHAIVSSWY